MGIINESVEVRLSYKDIALIAVAMGIYVENYGDKLGEELKKRSRHLVDRLKWELANLEKQDKIKTKRAEVRKACRCVDCRMFDIVHGKKQCRLDTYGLWDYNNNEEYEVRNMNCFEPKNGWDDDERI